MTRPKKSKTSLERIQQIEAAHAVTEIRYRHLRKAFDDFRAATDRRLLALEKDEA